MNHVSNIFSLYVVEMSKHCSTYSIVVMTVIEKFKMCQKQITNGLEKLKHCENS